MRKLITVVVARWRVIAWIAGMLVIAVAVGWVMYDVQKTKDQVAAGMAALEDEQQAAEDRGESPVAPAPSELMDDPTYSPEPQDESGPPPSDEQVRSAIAAYFDEHPIEDGKDATPEQIAEAVAEYLVQNPPKQGATGPPPTAEQVAAAVAEYLEANPPPPGPPGEAGRPPTAEEIADAVEAYIAEHPIDWCPGGSEPQEHEVLTVDSGTVTAVLCVKV